MGREKVLELLFLEVEIDSKENLGTMNRMEKEFIIQWMVTDMKHSSRMVNQMDGVLRIWKMVINYKVNSKMEK